VRDAEGPGQAGLQGRLLGACHDWAGESPQDQEQG